MRFIANFFANCKKDDVIKRQAKQIAEMQKILDSRAFAVDELPEVSGPPSNFKITELWNGLKLFDVGTTPFSRVCFPSNFPLNSEDPVARRKAVLLAEQLMNSVNGKTYFNISTIKEIIDMTGCAAPLGHKYLELLCEYHCEYIAEQDHELFNVVPDILNYIFSNGRTSFEW